MRTLKEQTLDLYERVRKDVAESGRFRPCNFYVSKEYGFDVAKSAIEGDRNAMLEIGISCLEAIGGCDDSCIETKKDLAVLGEYWLTEIVLHDTPWRRFKQNDASAYGYLAAAYMDEVSPFCDLYVKLHVQDVIPKDVIKLEHFLWEGAEYNEACALQLMAFYLDREPLSYRFYQFACWSWNRIRPIIENSHLGGDIEKPLFLIEVRNAQGFEHLHGLFQKVGGKFTDKENLSLVEKVISKLKSKS